MAGMLGKKIGMTGIFDGLGHFVPVTLIEAGPCFVLGTKTKELFGYSAVILGYEEIKPAKLKRPEKGYFKKLKVPPKKTVKEIRTMVNPGHKINDEIRVDMFKNGDYVDVTGTTIGKGFQGGMKRWNWRGGESGHGSMFHRRVGSVGASSFPSRVHRGKTMPGHMGSAKHTVQNMEVISVEKEKNLLVVRGSVPGHKGSILVVKHARKRPPDLKNEKN